MKRIIIHWTAGGYTPNSIDKEHYHYLVDKDGNVHNGKFKPEDNEVCKTGKYAAHTGGGNTGSIGVSLCGMYNFKNRNSVGPYPLRKIQVEAAFKLCADLASKYKIPITPQTIMTHYEFGLQNPKTSSAGKIDIVFLPPYSWVMQAEIGNLIRSKIRWYQQHS